MNKFTVYQFETNKIRVWRDSFGNPWFSVHDICRCGRSNNRVWFYGLPENQQGIANVSSTKSVLVVSFYGLVTASEKTRTDVKKLIDFIRSTVMPNFQKKDIASVAPSTTKTTESKPFALSLAFENPKQAITSETKEIAKPAITLSTEEKIATIFRIQSELEKVPGVNKSRLLSETLSCLQEVTGLPLDSMRSLITDEVTQRGR